jgi:maleylacetoacetate isomerase
MATLYSYWRSSASWRVRIALGLKGVPFTIVPVHLVEDGGQQHAAAYRSLNPSRLLPTLEIDGLVLAESMAIMEYLDETREGPRLLPTSPADRAFARRIAEMVNAGTQPLQNLRVLQFLEATYGQDAEGKRSWGRHWVTTAFDAIEPLLAARGDAYCIGETPTIADCCLIPQIYGAQRFGVAMDAYPTIARIDAACAKLAAFQSARPEAQPDAQGAP